MASVCEIARDTRGILKPHQASYTDIIRKTVATGTIAPKREVAIKPRLSGIIEKVFVQEGQMVKNGDPIAKVKIVPDMLSLNNAKNRIQMAELALSDAQQSYDRQKVLLDKGVIAQAEFQPLQTQLKTAKQELAAAESNLQLIEAGALKDQGNSSEHHHPFDRQRNGPFRTAEGRELSN